MRQKRISGSLPCPQPSTSVGNGGGGEGSLEKIQFGRMGTLGSKHPSQGSGRFVLNTQSMRMGHFQKQELAFRW